MVKRRRIILWDCRSLIDYSEKRVYVHDIRTLVCYDLDGKFIKRIPVPHLNGDACGVFDKGHILYSDSQFYIDRDNPLQLFLTDETGKELKLWQGYVEKYKSYKALMSTRDLMYNYQGAVYFKPAFENLIYRIDGREKRRLPGSLIVQVMRMKYLCQ